MDKINIINIGIEIRQAIINCVNLYKNKLINHISPKDLGGACAVASYIFNQKLLSLNCKSHFVYGSYRTNINHHCWVEYDNNIIDITATQYNRRFESVEILLIESSRGNNYNSKKYDQDALLSVRTWEEQDPNRYKYIWDCNNKLQLQYLG